MNAYILSLSENLSDKLKKITDKNIILLSGLIRKLRDYLITNNTKSLANIEHNILRDLSDVFSIFPFPGFLARNDLETSLNIIDTHKKHIKKIDKNIHKIIIKIYKILKLIKGKGKLFSSIVDCYAVSNVEISLKYQKATTYYIPPYVIDIFLGENENYYIVKPNIIFNDISVLLLNYLYLKIIEIIPASILSYNLDKLLSFLNKMCVDKLLLDFIDFNINYKDYIRNTSKYLCHKILGLHKLMAFLLDKNVQEIYLDGVNSHIYLDHIKYGRCLTNVRLSKQDIDRFIIRLKIETGDIVDETNPSLKAELITKSFSVRVSIDVSPLAVDEVVVDIRKHNIRLCSLKELIKNNMLSQDLADYLRFCMKYRPNLMIAGEPGTGKTTLLNALDREIPSFYRKLYIEDVVESIKDITGKAHQARYKVYPLESPKYKGKEIEVTKLLHRNPDYIILGEIQSKDQFQALFLALSAGLKCAFTCHSDSLKKLLHRIVNNYGINHNLLSLIDIIIFTRKTYYKSRIIRYVYKVYESTYSDNSFNFVKIYDKDISDNLLIYPTPFLKRIGKEKYAHNM